MKMEERAAYAVLSLFSTECKQARAISLSYDVAGRRNRFETTRYQN